MVTIQRVIDEISQMQEEQWNEKLNEDILLTKIENLERKIKDDDLTDETLRYRTLCDEMAELDQTSKKALRQSLQEKLLVQQQCDDLKMELNASEEENEKVIREVKTLQELIKEKNKAIGILEKTSDELEKRQKPEFEEIFEQVLARVKTKNINEEQFKALRELIIDEKEELNNSMSDFVALEDLSSKLGQFERECLELKRHNSELRENICEKEKVCARLEGEKIVSDEACEKAQEEINVINELLAFKDNEMSTINKERSELVAKVSQLHVENKSICEELLNQTTSEQNGLISENEKKQKIIYFLIGLLVVLLGMLIAK